MKYVITGGAGHISSPLTEALLTAGHQVTVVGRAAEKLAGLKEKGASTAIGSVEDVSFLTAAFAGADAVYIMIPPNYGVDNFRHFQNTVARNYIAAITANSIANVVALSSIGAHMGNGAGPVDGLADMEDLLSHLKGVNVKILRPSYFMYNLFGMLPMVKSMDMMGANFGGTNEKLVLVHTKDIAAVAAEELMGLTFTGQSIRYIASDEKSPDEIAHILGNAINKPALPWVVFTDEQSLQGMRQAGLPETIAEAYTTMGKAIREGKMQEDYWDKRPTLSNTKLEEFAMEFAGAFHSGN